VIRRREQPFRGTNTAQVKAAAAESDAPTPAAAAPAPAAGGRGRRQPRAEPTVDIASIKPGDILEGTVVSIGSVPVQGDMCIWHLRVWDPWSLIECCCSSAEIR
jgi:hypothetical protein